MLKFSIFDSLSTFFIFLYNLEFLPLIGQWNVLKQNLLLKDLVVASLEARSDDEEKLALGSSEGSAEECQEVAEGPKSSAERPGTLERFLEKRLGECLLGEEKREVQLQPES